MPYIPDPTNGAAPADTDTVSTASVELRALKTYIQTQITSLNAAIAAATPQTGEIRFMLSAPAAGQWLRIMPVAWVFSRATYPQLATWVVAMGAPWGNGDGITTINGPIIPTGCTIVQAFTGAGILTNGTVKDHVHLARGGSIYHPATVGTAPAQTATDQLVATGLPEFPEGGANNLAAGIQGLFYIHV